MNLFYKIKEWFRVQSQVRAELRRTNKLRALGCWDDKGIACKSDLDNLAKRIVFLADKLGYEENNDWIGGYLDLRRYTYQEEEVRFRKKKK